MYLVNTNVVRPSTNILETIDIEKSKVIIPKHYSYGLVAVTSPVVSAISEIKKAVRYYNYQCYYPIWVGRL